jgi:SAM-dependent methyltransferase
VGAGRLSEEPPAADLARRKWNERYAQESSPPFPDQPAEWLVEHRALLERPTAGRALDLACGDGRNARYLAELGYDVDAIDISDVVIGRLKGAAASLGLGGVSARVADLEAGAVLPSAEYDVIACFNYLQRNLFDPLAAALRPGGLLFYETFARPHIDELGHAFRADFVLGENELLHAFPGLHVRHYFEGVAERSGKPRGIASLVAERR